jgi:hypothetical protein
LISCCKNSIFVMAVVRLRPFSPLEPPAQG